jgi:hypothetical protein
VSLHAAKRGDRNQAMLYVMRVVALPIVCQAKKSRSAAAMLLLCAVACASVAACARTGLYPGELGDGELGAGDATSSSGGSGQAVSAAGGKSVGGAPVRPLPVAGMSGMAGVGGVAPEPPVTVTAGSPTVPVGEPTSCQPSAETCNGRDDDCNGAVDDLPAQACPDGGFRFCVAGRLSECPRRCDVCVPGSVRVCENSFCSYWGEEECAADGQGFGNCREAVPPPECEATAKKNHNSKQLEQCCIDNGYCCLDEHDLDGDGDRREMLGACGDIACQ